VFARLVVEDASATLSFLKQHTLSSPAHPALSVLLYIWARYHHEFTQDYARKVTTAALGALFAFGDEKILSTAVPCFVVRHVQGGGGAGRPGPPFCFGGKKFFK